MYGPNYSGFAFHPKAVRMVGSVHFGDFLRRIDESVTQSPLLQGFRAACRNIVVPVQISGSRGNPLRTRDPFDACDPRNTPDETPCAIASGLFPTEFPPVRPTVIPSNPAHPRPVEQAATTPERYTGSSSALWTPRPPPLHRTSDCFPGTYPMVASPRKQKRRVSRETRRPFPANRVTDQAVFFANPRYVSITRGFCASSAAGPSSANSPVSST